MNNEAKSNLKEERKRKNKQELTKTLTWIGASIVGLIFILPFIFSVLGILWGIPSVHFTTSEGERVAKVIKISEKGLIWKTWEAEAVLTQGDLVSTYVWEFSIDEEDPEKDLRLKELRQAFETGELVKIKYEERAGSVPWRSKTEYFLRGIRSSVE